VCRILSEEAPSLHVLFNPFAKYERKSTLEKFIYEFYPTMVKQPLFKIFNAMEEGTMSPLYFGSDTMHDRAKIALNGRNLNTMVDFNFGLEGWGE
jgi:hypothetical protein